MKKHLLALALLSVSGLASATVPGLGQPLADGTPFHPSQLDGAFAGFTGADTGDQWFAVKDTDGGLDDIVGNMYIELASYAPFNTFGIYQSDNAANYLEIFPGPAVPSLFSAKTIQWSFDGSQVCVLNGGGCQTGIDKFSFGFYLSGPGGTFYSANALNPGNQDQMWSFDVGGANGADFVLAFEDVAGGDADHNDFVIGIHDIQPGSPPSEVPVPGAVWMFGSALMGFLGLSRRKTQVISA